MGATPQVSAPGAPIGFGASAGNGQVALTWTAISGALSYNIYRSTTSNFTKSASNKIANPTGTTYNDTTVSNGTTYYYLVTAVNPGGESSPSSYTSATPQIPAPSSPAITSVTPAINQDTIVWSTVATATSYNLYWSTSPGVTTSTGTMIASVTSPFVHSGLTDGTTYYYILTAVNAGGQSSQSTEASGLPPLTAYIGGFSQDNSGNTYAGYWINGVWTRLPGLLTVNAASQVFCIYVSGSDIYAGGYSMQADGTKIAGYWKNGVWVGLPCLSAGNPSQVNSIVVSGGHVYAGGYSYDTSAHATAGYWVDGTWTPLAGPSPGAEITSMALQGTTLIAGGISDPTNVSSVGYWLNGTWTPLSELSANSSYLFATAVSGTDTYFAGYSFNPQPVAIAGYWKNGTWNALYQLSPTHSASAMSLAVSGGHVYVGGYNADSFGIAQCGYWIDGLWYSLGNLSANYGAQVNGIFPARGGLLAVGFNTDNTGLRIPGYWLNRTWNALSMEGTTYTQGSNATCVVWQ